MKSSTKIDIDAIADRADLVVVEIQKEFGFKDKYKLYIHINGITVFRICKIWKDNLKLQTVDGTIVNFRKDD